MGKLFKNLLPKNKTSSFLSIKQKTRYENAAKHFIAGGFSNFQNHFIQTKKIAHKERFTSIVSKNYNELIKKQLERINNNIDKIKKSKDTKKLLILGGVFLGAAILISNLINDHVIPKINKQIITFEKKHLPNIKQLLGSKQNDFFQKTNKFINEYLNGDISLSQQKHKLEIKLKEVTKKFADKFVNSLDKFFNENLREKIEELLTETTITAFNKSFQTSWGKILSLFFDKIQSRISRVDLSWAAEWGMDFYKEINQTEKIRKDINNSMIRIVREARTQNTKNGVKEINPVDYKKLSDYQKEQINAQYSKLFSLISDLTFNDDGNKIDTKAPISQEIQLNEQYLKDVAKNFESTKNIYPQSLQQNGTLLYSTQNKNTMLYKEEGEYPYLLLNNNSLNKMIKRVHATMDDKNFENKNIKQFIERFIFNSKREKVSHTITRSGGTETIHCGVYAVHREIIINQYVDAFLPFWNMSRLQAMMYIYSVIILTERQKEVFEVRTKQTFMSSYSSNLANARALKKAQQFNDKTKEFINKQFQEKNISLQQKKKRLEQNFIILQGLKYDVWHKTKLPQTELRNYLNPYRDGEKLLQVSDELFKILVALNFEINPTSIHFYNNYNTKNLNNFYDFNGNGKMLMDGYTLVNSDGVFKTTDGIHGMEYTVAMRDQATKLRIEIHILRNRRRIILTEMANLKN